MNRRTTHRRIVDKDRSIAPLDVPRVIIRQHFRQLEQKLGNGMRRGAHLQYHCIAAIDSQGRRSGSCRQGWSDMSTVLGLDGRYLLLSKDSVFLLLFDGRPAVVAAA